MRRERHYDLERAALLLHIIEEAGKHGPNYTRLITAAQQELTDLMNEGERREREPKVVTPPAGPENSAMENPDGSIRPIVPVKPDVGQAGGPRPPIYPPGQGREGTAQARPDPTPGQPQPRPEPYVSRADRPAEPYEPASETAAEHNANVEVHPRTV